MRVAQVSADSNERVKGGLPWHWLIFLPVLASVVAGLTTLGIAIRYADRPLPESVTRTGPVQYGENLGQVQARTMGLSATAQIDPAAHGIVLTLNATDQPDQLSLRLWHPTEANQDRLLLLTRTDDNRYRGVWPEGADSLRLLLTAPTQGWEMPGAMDTASHSLRFDP